MTAAHTEEKSQKIHHIYKWCLVVWSFSSQPHFIPYHRGVPR